MDAAHDASDRAAGPLEVPEPAQGTTRWAAWPFDAARAQFVAWSVLAIVNAVSIAVLRPWPAGGLKARVVHHLFDAGQLLAAGLLGHGVVRIWQRWGPRRRAWAYVALLPPALALAWLLVPEEASGFIARQEEAGSRLPWEAILSVSVAVTVPMAAFVGTLLGKGWRRAIGVVLAISLASVNQRVLPQSYASLHLFAALGAALVLAGALGSWDVVRLPAFLCRAPVRVAAHATLAVAAAVVVVAPPPASVAHELNALPGAVVAQLTTRLRSADDWQTPGELAASPWFRDRSALPPVPPSSPPLLPSNAIVLLLVVDAMRADVFQPEHARMLPTLHGLAKESVHFTMARAPSAGTLTSIHGIFTGKFYSQTFWSPLERGRFKGHLHPHRDPSPRLPVLLSDAGISTVHIAGSTGLVAETGVTTGFREEILGSKTFPLAQEMTDLTIERLERAGPDERIFLYAHYMEAHSPYDRAGKQGTPFQRYLRELANVDREIKRLREWLRANDMEERAVLIVTADHGEAFGEHGTEFHTVTLYEELIRVPLLIAGRQIPGRTVDVPVSLVDLGPTVLDLAGLPTPGVSMGQSLVPFLRGQMTKLERPIAAESARLVQTVIFPDGIKVVYDARRKTTELYDLNTDPQELRNLIDVFGPRTGFYVGATHAFFEANAYRVDGYVPKWRPH